MTATDTDDKLFEQANRGTHIAVAAPGVDILAAAPDGGYQMQSGTSFAAAQVSGIAALLLERNPQARCRRDPPHPDVDGARSWARPAMTISSAPGLPMRWARSTPAGPKSSDVSAAPARREPRLKLNLAPPRARLTISEHTRSSVGASAPFHLRVGPAGPPGRSPSGRAVILGTHADSRSASQKRSSRSHWTRPRRDCGCRSLPAQRAICGRCVNEWGHHPRNRGSDQGVRRLRCGERRQPCASRAARSMR